MSVPSPLPSLKRVMQINLFGGLALSWPKGWVRGRTDGLCGVIDTICITRPERG